MTPDRRARRPSEAVDRIRKRIDSWNGVGPEQFLDHGPDARAGDGLGHARAVNARTDNDNIVVF